MRWYQNPGTYISLFILCYYPSLFLIRSLYRLIVDLKKAGHRPAMHRHKYEIVGVDPQTFITPKYTYVLKVCNKCGNPTTSYIEGVWTLDQIKGVSK